jgi:hypothetical protein
MCVLRGAIVGYALRGHDNLLGRKKAYGGVFKLNNDRTCERRRGFRAGPRKRTCGRGGIDCNNGRFVARDEIKFIWSCATWRGGRHRQIVPGGCLLETQYRFRRDKIELRQRCGERRWRLLAGCKDDVRAAA